VSRIRAGRAEIHEFVVARGADRLDHPGGTLAEHLRRVGDLLDRLGRPEPLVRAGRAHAAYGTDGFGTALLDHDRERGVLRELIGAGAEAQVYRYGSCDRRATWPGLADHRTVTDRFTGATTRLADHELRDFVDLAIVNELDVLSHAEKFAADIRTLVTGMAALASPTVRAEVERCCR
jgi:hypothetical protein